MTQAGKSQNSLKEWAKSIGFAVVAWLILRTFVVQAFHITSESMEEHPAHRAMCCGWRGPLFGAKLPFSRALLPAFREPRHGDIVIFESVETAGLDVVKRVIGLPGDTLAMQSGSVIRNGQPVEEPYARRARADEPDPGGSRAQMRRVAGDPAHRRAARGLSARPQQLGSAGGAARNRSS